MNGEFAVGGVLLSSMLAAVLIALVAAFALRRLLGLVGAYRFIWHPALFDAALFVILWAAVVALSSRLHL
ncbi:MAG: DUF1656 domain-containing protein [Steroidobacteraceae bacterium]